MIQISDVETSGARSLNRSTLSIQQRKRTGKLTMKDLTVYFHIPIEAAAKKINFCPTVIKKVCRKHGLSRWPYRKIRSIEKKISMRATYLTSVDVEERGRAQVEIDTLRQEIANIYSRYNA
ncbi:RWP-RK domain-containing protein [Tanacetum coccineum]